MNDYLLATLLGLIEGLTVFLAVSSTAHLRIAEAALGIDLGNGYWKMFSIVIQLGAILALPIYFRRRIAEFIHSFVHRDRSEPLWQHPLSLTTIAFLFTAGPAFLLTKVIGKHLENLTLMASALIIGGVVMWVVDAICGPARLMQTASVGAAQAGHRTESMEQMTLAQAIWIGACQTLSAVFPGTSRSMATIAAGQLAGLSRAAALEFSFFLSIPTMLAATGYDLLKTVHGGASTAAIGPSQIGAHGWMLLAIGALISFIVALAVVAWFMNWVRTRGFAPFAVYRILLGAGVLFWLTRR